MESGQSFNSHATGGSVSSAPKPAETLSPVAYYQDPKRQRRQRHWHIAKFALHCIAWFLAVPLIIIDIYIVCYVNSFDQRESIFTLFPYGLSAAWTTAELITIMSRRNLSRGIGPRWQLSIHLILWCACAAICILVAPRYVSFWLYYGYSRDFQQLMYEVPVVKVATLALLVIIHFVLFVRYCVEVNRRNSEKQVNRVFNALARLDMRSRDATFAYENGQQVDNPQHQTPPPPVHSRSADPSIELPEITRRPVGGPVSKPPPDTDPGSYRVIDPDIEANFKFMGPLPMEPLNANLKYPSRVARKA